MPKPAQPFQGKTVLVTGATSRIGEVICDHFCGSGARVYVAYHQNETRAGEIVRRWPQQAAPLHMDAKDEQDVKRAAARCESSLGEVDIIVLCAVAPYKWASPEDHSVEDIAAHFQMGAVQTALAARYFTRKMIAQGWGRIVGISSECLDALSADQMGYVVGKSGMRAALFVLAKNLGKHGVTCNEVAPGWVPEDDSMETPKYRDYLSTRALKTRLTARHVAEVVGFLASERSDLITSQTIVVNGGKA